MTQEDIIKMAREDIWLLEDVPREMITKEVVDNINIITAPNACYMILKGIDSNNISKKMAMNMLYEDGKTYLLFSDELKKDEDILNILTKDYRNMPHYVLQNEDAIRHVLKKYNIDNDNWAVYSKKDDVLVINTKNEAPMVYEHGFDYELGSERSTKEYLNLIQLFSGYKGDLWNVICIKMFTDYPNSDFKTYLN